MFFAPLLSEAQVDLHAELLERAQEDDASASDRVFLLYGTDRETTMAEAELKDMIHAGCARCGQEVFVPIKIAIDCAGKPRSQISPMVVVCDQCRELCKQLEASKN